MPKTKRCILMNLCKLNVKEKQKRASQIAEISTHLHIGIELGPINFLKSGYYPAVHVYQTTSVVKICNMLQYVNTIKS